MFMKPEQISSEWNAKVPIPSELTLQLPDPLQAKTVQSEVRRGLFTLPVFQRGQVHILPRFILSAFWVPGHTAEMTDKTEATSWAQPQLALIDASQETSPPSTPPINKPNFVDTLRNLKSVNMKDAFHIDQTEQAEWILCSS